MDKRRLLPIFLIVFIDLLGFSLILPLLPYYAENYGATPLIIGLLTASYAAAQLIGAPLLGRMSDRYGRRPILLVSISGTLIGFLLLGFAEPLGNFLADALGATALANAFILGILFLSRIIDGLTGGNISVAQAYITDVTDARNRAQGLGLIGAAFGLGFIIGPAVGGILSSYSYALPALIAAGLSLINLISVFFWLPESLSVEDRGRLQAQKRPAITARALRIALQRPRVGPLLQIRFFFGLAFATFQTIFALFAQSRLNLDVRQTGFVLTYVGVLSVLVQGFAVGRISKRFPENRVIFISTIIMAVSLLFWAFTPGLWYLIIILAPLAVAGGILNTILSSSLSKSVLAEEVGGTLGLAAAVESSTRVLAPSIGGFLLGQFGAWAPGIFSALLMTWVVFFAWRKLIVNPDPPLVIRPDNPEQAVNEISS
jgi:DHA1 family tetracycline resistance protein-like MFS transporter